MGHPQKKHIGILLKAYPRLSEAFINHEILLLEKRGFRLHIFALGNPVEPKVHDSVRQIRAQVTYLPNQIGKNISSMLKTNIKLALKKRTSYWSAFRFALKTSIRQKSFRTFKRFLQACYLVENILVEDGQPKNTQFSDHDVPFDNSAVPERVDIAHFHAHFSHDPTTIAYFVWRLTQTSYSLSAHARDIYVQEKRFLREKIRHAKFVVTCTNYNKRYINKIACSLTPIFRSYHGSDLNLFSSVLKLKNNVPCILSVGRFIPKKGFVVLIKALKQLKQSGYRFQCHLIGSGPLEVELRNQILRSGLRDCVKLLPALSQRELLIYYQRADIFALASEVQADGDRDAIPNVIVEAMAMGIPVVSTNISGIPECVENYRSGILVEPHEPQAMAEAIGYLLDHPDKARQFGKAGREKVEKDFDAHQNIRPIATALREVLGLRMREQVSVTAGDAGSQQSEALELENQRYHGTMSTT